ncbi:MAG: hypothetical protein FWG69_04290 [Oscillospiraceae bacterium]|nr:hypothetical protein [Oscillospiraceae bacterium]
MKKRISAIILCAIIMCTITIALAGCSRNPQKYSGENSNDGVDVDLTSMNETMLSAELNNIKENPDDYLGKTIKINGDYFPSYDQANNKYYHSVITKSDPNNCCTEGILFSRNENYKYPEDYPAEGSKIEMTGLLKKAEEQGYFYPYLETDEIKELR